MAKKNEERNMATYRCLETCYFKKTLIMEDQVVEVDSSTEMPKGLFEKVTNQSLMVEAVRSGPDRPLRIEPDEIPEADVKIV